MSDQPILRHLMTLCHADDCCPEIYHDEAADTASCVVVRDDDGNEARFGPLDLLQKEPILVEQQLCLRDAFGSEVYMTQGQYDVLFMGEHRQLLQAVAEGRGVSLLST